MPKSRGVSGVSKISQTLQKDWHIKMRKIRWLKKRKLGRSAGWLEKRKILGRQTAIGMEKQKTKANSAKIS